MDPFDSFFESLASTSVLGFKASRSTLAFLSPLFGQNGACTCLGTPANLGEFLERFTRGFAPLEGTHPDIDSLRALEGHQSYLARRKGTGHVHAVDWFVSNDALYFLLRDLEGSASPTDCVTRALSLDFASIHRVSLRDGSITLIQSNPRIEGLLSTLPEKERTCFAKFVEAYFSSLCVEGTFPQTSAFFAFPQLESLSKEGKPATFRYFLKEGDVLKQSAMEATILPCPEDPSTLVLAFRCIDEAIAKEKEASLRTEKALGELAAYKEETTRNLKSIETGLWTVEKIPGKPERFIADKTCLDILGLPHSYTPEKVMEEFQKRIDPRDLERFAAYDRELLLEGRGECTYRYNHDELGNIYVRCTGWRDDSRKDGIVFHGSHVNIDRVYRQEMALKEELESALARASEASEAKSTFLARMSHDLRTPLNGIIGMLDLSDARSNDVAFLASCRDKMRRASSYLLSLLNDILDMSKLERDALRLSPSRLSFNDFSSSLLEILSPLAAEKGVILDLSSFLLPLSEDLYADETLLRRVFINLLSNAIKYNRPGGKAEASAVLLEKKKTSAKILFLVRDDGIGMDEEFQKKMFEPFSQAGESVSDHGAGLGLSIVSKVVALLGGTLSVDSAPGKGTLFRLILDFPLLPHEEKKAPPASRPDSLRGEEVLVVEDNDLNAEILCFLLEGAGAKTTRARDGLEGLEAFARSPEGHYGLVLMDIMMPNLNGLDAARRIRALPREDARRVPILAMSANAYQEDKEMSMEAGMNAHIAKPFDKDETLRLAADFAQRYRHP